MAPKQATLSQFFGAPGSGRPTQTKLAFARRKETDEAVTEKENKVKVEKDDEETKTDKTKKPSRAEKKRSPEPVQSGDESEPVPKRARKGREVVRKDSDSEVEVKEVKKEVEVPKANKEAQEVEGKKESEAEKASPKRSPKKKRSPSPKKSAIRDDDESIASEEAEEELVREEEDDEDRPGKPASAAKVRKAVQAALATIKEDAYPDWAAGAPVPYAALCRTFSLIEQTTKRLIIMEYCSLFLRQVLRLTPNELLPTVLLMVNKLAPDYAGIELGIGESLIMKAIGEATGRSMAVIKQDQKEIGDLGLVAVKSRSTQPTMFKQRALTVVGVHKGLMAIATVSGNGAHQRKVDGIKRLLAAADTATDGASEAKFLVRFLEGKLRLGLAEKTVLVSLAQAAAHHEAAQAGRAAATPAEVETAEATLKTVYSELPSYDLVVAALLAHGVAGLREHCQLQPGIPLKPMLAKPTKSITEVLDRFEDQTFTCEYKYDGERAQIHYVAADAATGRGGLAAIFSRNSEDLSSKYPDILAALPGWLQPGTQSLVLDCETVGWDVAARRVLPFQQLMTRKRKDVRAADVQVRVCVFAFDLLYLNGTALVRQPLRDRRAALATALVTREGELALATHMDGQELDEIQSFLDESVRASCEGLMVKMLDGPESAYEPSKRSRNWLKIKKDYLAGVGDSLDLVVLGAYFGRGKRTSVYGAFLLACYNPAAEAYETICNIGTGFSEADLEALHTQLAALVIARPKPFYAHSAGGPHQPDVWFEPRCVWEVRTADLTLSPRYKAACHEGVDTSGGGGGGDSRGISLRFPRFIRVREDKKPDEATTSRQVADMFRRQESVAKTKGPSVDDDFEY